MRLLVLLLPALPLAADIIYLKHGGKIEGKVLEDLGDSYKIESAAGTVTVKKEDIDKIEPKPWTPPPRKEPVTPKVRLDAVFRHPFLAFRMKMPKKWEQGKPVGGSTASIYGPKDGIFHPRVDLWIEKSSMSLEDYVARHQKDLKEHKDYQDVKFTELESFQCGKHQGFKFVARFREGIVPMQTAWSFVGAGERKFTLMFYCTEKLYQKYDAEISAIFASLRIFDEPKLGESERRKYTTAYNAAVDLMQKQKFEEAAAQFKKARDLVPGYPDIHNAIGLCYKNLRRWKEASEAFGKAAELDPDEFTYQMNLCVILVQLAEYDRALKHADRCIELEPDNEAGYANKGVILVAQEQFEKAKEVLVKACELNPESYIAHYFLGFCYEKLGNKKAAEREYKDTLKINPKHQGAKDGLERLKK